MAKVISNIKLRGTLGDITYYNASNQELAREKGDSGITKKQFAENPIFTKIKQHGKEFGRCARQSRVFRLLAKPFYDRAKEVSFAGRVNALLFEVMEEDTIHPRGARTLAQGLAHPESASLFLHFEGNKLRPLKRVLKKPVVFDWDQYAISLTSLHAEADLLWPEPDANQVHLQVAVANWNYTSNTFEHHFSPEIIVGREDMVVPLSFPVARLSAQDLWFAYLFIGFSNKERKKTKFLHKKWNTATIIGVKGSFDD